MNSIQELIDFAESIPEDQWLMGRFCELEDTKVKQRACFIGHLNFHLTGDYMEGIHWGIINLSSEIGQLLGKLDLDRRDLMYSNNGTCDMDVYGGTPKVRIKSFLASKLLT